MKSWCLLYSHLPVTNTYRVAKIRVSNSHHYGIGPNTNFFSVVLAIQQVRLDFAALVCPCPGGCHWVGGVRTGPLRQATIFEPGRVVWEILGKSWNCYDLQPTLLALVVMRTCIDDCDDIHFICGTTEGDSTTGGSYTACAALRGLASQRMLLRLRGDLSVKAA